MKEFPRSIQNQAASVNMAAGRSIDRREIIQVLLLQLEVWYELFLRGSFESILEVWRKFADMLGARVRVILSEGSMEGTAEDVAPDGSLMVRDDKGSIHRVIVGDVVRCRPV
jgi:BirA family biotin operon repressor/biotin-[acetyl-CoA-carboxylase] ligase